MPILGEAFSHNPCPACCPMPILGELSLLDPSPHGSPPGVCQITGRRSHRRPRRGRGRGRGDDSSRCASGAAHCARRCGGCAPGPVEGAWTGCVVRRARLGLRLGADLVLPGALIGRHPRPQLPLRARRRPPWRCRTAPGPRFSSVLAVSTATAAASWSWICSAVKRSASSAAATVPRSVAASCSARRSSLMHGRASFDLLRHRILPSDIPSPPITGQGRLLN